jgi:acetyl esterase/lipase
LRSKGYKANNQLRDQRNAFEWVKKYISGFGGDPDNVTAIAESAGAGKTVFVFPSPSPSIIPLCSLGILRLQPTPIVGLCCRETFSSSLLTEFDLTS